MSLLLYKITTFSHKLINHQTLDHSNYFSINKKEKQINILF